MPAPAPVTRIVTRMYRIGTGDCFALKFFKGRSRKASFRMLIDCGSCRGDAAHFEPFLDDLAAWVDHHLDLLVVTHEHLDHVNGFAKGREVFEQFTIDHVWMAWTENPADPDAVIVKDTLGVLQHAVSLALGRMEAWQRDTSHHLPDDERADAVALDGTRTRYVDAVRELLSFHESGLDEPLAADGDSELSRSMTFLRDTLIPKTGKDVPDFLLPGSFAPPLSGAEGIRIFVLGPPKSVDALKVKTAGDDMYERKQALGAASSFRAALGALDPDGDGVDRPFDDAFVMSDGDATALTEAAFRGRNAWRDVSFDWLQAAGELALRLHTHTNNTSVALAIEFIGSGKVLLFPGDAEIGHWRSWHAEGMSWAVEDGDATKTVTARDLLARTVLYKVGHHSSHNGTARVSGLDLMTSDDLHAMIPLDMARIGPGWHKTMPSPGVIRELIRRTKGRLFRIDEGLLSDWAPSDDWDATVSMSADERTTFTTSHRIEPLFIELDIRG